MSEEQKLYGDPNGDRGEQIAEHLRGTCMGDIDGAAQTLFGIKEEDLTAEELQTIDLEIFLCEECGWWCERSEEDEENFGYCESCVECWDDKD